VLCCVVLCSGEEIAKAMTDATRQAKIDAGLLSPDDIDLEDMDIKEDLFLGDDEEYEDLDDLLDDEDDDDDEDYDDEEDSGNEGEN
jgi:hypothetical protein